MVQRDTEALNKQIQYELAFRELARRSLLDFTKYTMSEFDATPFHSTYYTVLDYFARGLLKKLIVTIGPQLGKSEGSSRRLPSYIFGKRPNSRIAILSYAASFAEGFNRDVQRIIDTQEYGVLFPKTRLATAKDKGFKRTNTRFELPGHRGWLKTIGVGGPLTGDPVDIAILDDLYKDAAQGNSPVIRNKVIEWYTSVVLKRLHNDSQQLIVFTRWHEEDLIGWLEENDRVITLNSWDQLENIDNTCWYKINFPSLQNKAPTELDPRALGEPLYPKKHSREKMENERALDPEKFEAMNQGDPTPKEGLLYAQGFKTYRHLPRDIKKISNYTDTADRGKDYLCSINYKVGIDNYIYVTDILYTQAPQEETEPLTKELFERDGIREAVIESNNGGRAFARNVDRLCNFRIVIDTFHQSENKESRILTNAAEVQRTVLFPEGWEYKWPAFYKAITRFKREFRANTFDDAPDTLTGVLEFSGVSTNASDILYKM